MKIIVINILLYACVRLCVVRKKFQHLFLELYVHFLRHKFRTRKRERTIFNDMSLNIIMSAVKWIPIKGKYRNTHGSRKNTAIKSLT